MLKLLSVDNFECWKCQALKLFKVLKMLSVENVTTKGNEHSPGKKPPVLHVRLYRKGLNWWFVDIVVAGCGCGWLWLWIWMWLWLVFLLWLWLVVDVVVPGRLGSSPTQQMQTWWGRKLRQQYKMTRIELRVTFPKSVEVFGWRKNGVKLMRRKSFVETRDTVAAVDVTGVYALPGFCEAK